MAAGELDPNHIPNLNKTAPTDDFGPFPQWKDPKKIVTIDPWGHLVTDVFGNYLKKVRLLIMLIMINTCIYVKLSSNNNIFV